MLLALPAVGTSASPAPRGPASLSPSIDAGGAAQAAAAAAAATPGTASSEEPRWLASVRARMERYDGPSWVRMQRHSASSGIEMARHRVTSLLQSNSTDADGASSATCQFGNGSDAPRLAVLTYISRDAPEFCDAFMRYYIDTQRIAASDIHVIDAGSQPDQHACYRKAGLPQANVRVKAPGSDVYSDEHRLSTLMELQRELLDGNGYTHTLVVDLDEIVMPNSDKYDGLIDYLGRNRHRGVVAPQGYEVQFAPSLGESALDWERRPLLEQRGAMVKVCGMDKPILARVPTTFTFSTHFIAAPPYRACFDEREGCVDPDLLLIHTKCIDEKVWLQPELFDRDRGGGDASATREEAEAALLKYVRSRCGDVETWAGSPCGLGAAGQSAACADGVQLTFGLTSAKVKVEQIPEWAQKLF